MNFLPSGPNRYRHNVYIWGDAMWWRFQRSCKMCRGTSDTCQNSTHFLSISLFFEYLLNSYIVSNTHRRLRQALKITLGLGWFCTLLKTMASIVLSSFLQGIFCWFFACFIIIFKYIYAILMFMFNVDVNLI